MRKISRKTFPDPSVSCQPRRATGWLVAFSTHSASLSLCSPPARRSVHLLQGAQRAFPGLPQGDVFLLGGGLDKGTAACRRCRYKAGQKGGSRVTGMLLAMAVVTRRDARPSVTPVARGAAADGRRVGGGGEKPGPCGPALAWAPRRAILQPSLLARRSRKWKWRGSAFCASLFLEKRLFSFFLFCSPAKVDGICMSSSGSATRSCLSGHAAATNKKALLPWLRV